MSRERIEFYQKRARDKEASLKNLQKKIRLIGVGRLSCFLLAVGVAYSLFSFGTIWWLSPIIVFGGAFIYFVNLDKKWQYKKEWLKTLVYINQQEAKAMAGDYDEFHNGLNFLDPEHAYAYDLDIFGEGSIFQYLNRTTSPKGRQVLAEWLRAPAQSIEEIKNRQEALLDLNEHTDFLQNFRASGFGLEESSQEQQKLLDWLNEKSRYRNSIIYRFLLIALPLLTITMVSLTILGVVTATTLLFYLIIPFSVAGYHFKAATIEQDMLSNNINLLQNHSWQLKEIESLSTDNSYLKELQATIGKGQYSASSAIHQLAKLLDALDNRQNLLAGFVLNVLLLWDLQCIARLEKWREQHREQLPKWFSTIHTFEALTSLAVFRFNHEDFTMPELRDEQPVLEAKGLGHPLLSAEERVDNDLTMDDNGSVVIITGANMAGKSTFLRSVGVSLVLAMAGAPVCARQYKCQPFQVFTSMRTTDSLLHHESHFYAELKRLQQVVEQLQKGVRLFVILDELLRGTNSTDQHKGAKAMIEKIVAMKGTGLIATHDLKLGELADKYPQQVRNMCFEVTPEGDKLHFDYKLRNGISQNMNATYLLKKMNIISDQEKA